MEKLKKWKRERKKFVISISVIAILFYVSLPLCLIFFPEQMNKAPFGGFSWAWIYAFLQMGMTWVFGWLYWRKAKQLDEFVAEIDQEATE